MAIVILAQEKELHSKEYIIQLYNDGLSSIEVAQKLGISKKTVLKILRNHNIPRRSLSDYATWNKISKETLEDLYIIKQYSATKIGKLYQTDHHTILSCLKHHSIPIRKQIFHSCNNLFFNYQTPIMAYILGFITADGCIQGNQLSFGLKDSDEEILIYIKEQLDYNGPIRYWTKKKNLKIYRYATLQINDKNIVESLKTFKIIERKTGQETFPKNLEQKFYGYWLRGLFDGDGCIYYKPKKKRTWSLASANRQFLCDIQSKILNNIGTICKKLNKKNNKYNYSLDIYNKKDIAKIYNIMYNDNQFALRRKKNKMELACDI